MHHPKTRFSNRVENYIRYRPSYPKKIVQDLELNDHLHNLDRVADIGSGTGISTELFLAWGYSCIGVEPNREMRTAAERELAALFETHQKEGQVSFDYHTTVYIGQLKPSA